MQELFSIKDCIFIWGINVHCLDWAEIQFCLLILTQRQDKLEIESSGLIDMETRRRIQSGGVRDSIHLEMQIL